MQNSSFLQKLCSEFGSLKKLMKNISVMHKFVLLLCLLSIISLLHARSPLNKKMRETIVKFSIPDKFQTEPYPHMWERSVGACHALTGLREDYRIALKQVKNDLGFQMVRFHGLLNDDMSVYLPTAPKKYNFYNIDNLFDFYLSIGMKPLVELSFMPTALASGNQTVFYYKVCSSLWLLQIVTHIFLSRPM